MFAHILHTALRGFWRQKLHSLITVGSLALGLTVFSFAFLYVQRELSYNRSWPDAERIHRLVVEQRGMPGMTDGSFNSTVGVAYESFRENFAAELDALTRVHASAARPADAESPNYSNIAFVDPGFAAIFPYEPVQGSLAQVLATPGMIALEESYASSLGERGNYGERLTLESGQGGAIEFEIGAIYRLPPLTSLQLQHRMVTLAHDYALPFFVRPAGSNGQTPTVAGWNNSTQILLKLKPGLDTAGFNALQQPFIAQTVRAYDKALGEGRRVEDHLFWRWQPVTEMHFNPVTVEASSWVIGDMARVLTFAAVGILVLLAGCSNAVSLSLAAALERRREIGVRKSAGALPQDILRQYLGEALLLTLLATILALSAVEQLQPLLQRLAPQTFGFNPIVVSWADRLLLAGIALLVGLANGLYPALILSRVRPQAVLRTTSDRGLSNGQRLRNWLVGAQFCCATMLLIGTSTLYIQLAVTRAQPLGFAANSLLMLALYTEQERATAVAFMNELNKTPGVEQVIPTPIPPNMNMPLTVNSMILKRSAEDATEARAQMVMVHPDFHRLLEMPLLAGRHFDPALDRQAPQESSNSSASSQITRALINRTAAHALGYESPEQAVQQTVRRNFTNPQNGEVIEAPIEIIGVVEDSMYSSFSRRPGAEVFIVSEPPFVSSLLLKYEPQLEDSIRERVQAVAARVNGTPLQYFTFMQDSLDTAFAREKAESRLLLICGGLALLLASIGLYGLAAFTVERRVKEVGIRKALGATAPAITQLYLWRFSKPVLVANVVAWPVALYFVLQWIERFPYQLDKSWLLPICLGASALVLGIALSAVGLLVLRAAGARPVQSLRYE